MGFNPVSMVTSFLDPSQGYKDAQKQLEQAWAQAQSYETPFWQAGLDQLEPLTNAENALLNPIQLQSDWTNSYETSPYAQQLQKEAYDTGMNQASTMGLTGSSAAMNNIANTSTNIMEKDREQYLNDLMQKYMTGIGIGKDIYGIGAQMGTTLGNQAMQYGGAMAGGAYGAQNSPGMIVGNALNAFMKGLGAAVGAG